jgi:hypothetical protein
MHSGIPMEPMTEMQIGLRLRERRPGSGRPDSDYLGSDHLGSGVCVLELELGVVYSVAVVLVV